MYIFLREKSKSIDNKNEDNMSDETLHTKWKKTKQELNFHERKLIDSYLQFLRDTAEFFIRRGNCR